MEATRGAASQASACVWGALFVVSGGGGFIVAWYIEVSSIITLLWRHGEFFVESGEVGKGKLTFRN